MRLVETEVLCNAIGRKTLWFKRVIVVEKKRRGLIGDLCRVSSGGLDGIGEKGTKIKSITLDLGNWRLMVLFYLGWAE